MAFAFQRIEPAPIDAQAEQIMVPMRDRVRLATDLYLPPGPGRHPAVLVRLPYDKCGRYTFMPYLAPPVTERGYVFVVQDVRGKFRSEGETVPFSHEVEDGYDTLEWIISQPWSNGVVGMFGDSYYGFTQWAAVAGGHPALRAIVPRVTTADLDVRDLQWSGGVSSLYGADYLTHFWVDNYIYDYTVDWSQRPLAHVFDQAFAAIGARSAGFDNVLRRSSPAAGAAYPTGHPFDALKIPALHCVGWFDNIGPDAMRDYMALRGRPQAAQLQYLIADSTDHENYALRELPITPDNDHDTNDRALARLIPEYIGPALDFYDVFLQNKSAADGVPMVRWNLGHDRWHTAPTWPPPGARELRLYPAGAGEALHGAEGGALRPSAEPGVSAARWIHDPDHLVPSTVMNPFAFLKEQPDERAVESRDDVLTFTGEALDRPLDLAGPVSAFLRVGSSGSSMHVFVKLADVAPDGAALMLARGQVLARWPDPDELVRIDLGHTGYRLQPGHRLRLHVACSDFPLYMWHPGTDENPWFARTGTPNNQTLVAGGSPASYLSLSVLD